MMVSQRPEQTPNTKAVLARVSRIPIGQEGFCKLQPPDEAAEMAASFGPEPKTVIAEICWVLNLFQRQVVQYRNLYMSILVDICGYTCVGPHFYAHLQP